MNRYHVVALLAGGNETPEGKGKEETKKEAKAVERHFDREICAQQAWDLGQEIYAE